MRLRSLYDVVMKKDSTVVGHLKQEGIFLACQGGKEPSLQLLCCTCTCTYSVHKLWHWIFRVLVDL